MPEVSLAEVEVVLSLGEPVLVLDPGTTGVVVDSLAEVVLDPGATDVVVDSLAGELLVLLVSLAVVLLPVAPGVVAVVVGLVSAGAVLVLVVFTPEVVVVVEAALVEVVD